MTIPSDIRDRIRSAIWDRADELNWVRLSDHERTVRYEQWASDPSIGGVLSRFIDARKVRVYIKDSLLRPYMRRRGADSVSRVLGSLAIDRSLAVAEEFEKPLGRRLIDGTLFSWGNSRDWKTLLLNTYERSYGQNNGKLAVVLFETGHTEDPSIQQVVLSAGKCLGINQIVWLSVAG
jgi:hypothetical protein